MTSASISEKTRRGGLWVAGAQLFTRLSQFGVTIVLARLLYPADYGLVGMAVVVSGIVSVVGNIGITAALIQTRDDIEQLSHTAFWMNIGVSLCLMALQILISPLAANFYGTPAVARIMQVTALSYLFSPLGIIHSTILSRDLRFKERTKLQLIVLVCSSILSISLAWFGAGAWSLVLPGLLVGPLNVMILWRLVSWRPKFIFNTADARKIFRFGRNVLLTDVIRYLGNNLDYLLIGRLFGTQPLGYYTFAYNQSTIGMNVISSVVGEVAFPAYAAFRRVDRSFEQAYRRSTSVVALMTFPVQLGLLLVAHLYIPLVFSERWAAAIPLFQIMVFAGAIRSVATLGGGALYAAGKPEIELRWNLIVVPLMVTSILIGSLYGVLGIAVATGVLVSIAGLIFVFIVCRTLKWSYWSLLSVLKPAAVSTVVMFVFTGVYLLLAGALIKQPAIILATTVMIGALVYFLMLRFFFPDSLEEMIWLVTGKRQSLFEALRVRLRVFFG